MVILFVKRDIVCGNNNKQKPITIMQRFRYEDTDKK